MTAPGTGFSPGRERALDSEEQRHISVALLQLATLQQRGWVLRVPGADGLGCLDHPRRNLRVIHSVCREADSRIWAHVSISRRDRQMPTWEQTRDVFREVMGDTALGVIVVPPASEHVNLAEIAHVWACLDERPIPDFTRGTGTI